MIIKNWESKNSCLPFRKTIWTCLAYYQLLDVQIDQDLYRLVQTPIVENVDYPTSARTSICSPYFSLFEWERY